MSEENFEYLGFMAKVNKPKGVNAQSEQIHETHDYSVVKFGSKKLSSEEKPSKFPFIKERKITLLVPLFGHKYKTPKIPSLSDKEFYEQVEIESQLEKGFTKPELFNHIKDIYSNLSKTREFFIKGSQKQFGDLVLDKLYKKQVDEKIVWIIVFHEQ